MMAVWMLCNMWITLIMLELNHEFCAGWKDLAQLFICSIISPITLTIAFWIYNEIQERREKK